MNEHLLIQKVAAIDEKYDFVKQETGGYYNIFNITGIGQQEVLMCKIFYDLLNPKGSHYQGTLYLRLFVEKVLRRSLPKLDLQRAQVFREYPISRNRRIDLYIKTPHVAIPIEVKINAGDQVAQCEDYYQLARQSKLIYLTKYGDAPSSESSGKLLQENIQCISFKEDILDWLELCLQQPETIKMAPIREVLLQLIDVIRTFTNQLGDETQMEIQQLISANSHNMKSALQIAQSIEAVRIDLLKRLFQAFEQRIALARIHDEAAYDYDDFALIKKYYKTKKKEEFALTYPYEHAGNPDIEVYFSIEVDHKLYAGFYVYNELNEHGLTKKEIQEILPHVQHINDGGSFIHWSYLPLFDEEARPNFAEPGLEDNYLRLFDEAYFEQFVRGCLDSLEILYGAELLK